MAGNRKVAISADAAILVDLANKVSSTLDADVIVYEGDIDGPCYSWLNRACRSRKRRTNVLLMIHTHGGSADVAYRIARCLQRHYERFIIYLNGHCKSAGTIIAVGADELVVPDTGELGPLDVQLTKPDELGEVSSGLTIPNALATLQSDAFNLWEYFFIQIKDRSYGVITTKTASEIAAGVVGQLFAPIYAQIDPHRLGEINRDVRISVEYGDRLDRNLKPGALAKLVGDYPSHDFVIDREEAEGLFRTVRPPTDDEQALANEVTGVVHPILESTKYPFAFLDDIIAALTPTEGKDVSADNHAAKPRAAPKKKPRGSPNDGKAATAGVAGRNGEAATVQ